MLCLSLLLWLLVTFAKVVTVPTNDTKCVQIPKRELQFCCELPEFDMHAYMPACEHYADHDDAIFGMTRYNPCVVACIFDVATGVDENYNLNMQNIELVLVNVIKDVDFRLVYLEGFRHCAPIVKAKILKRLARHRKNNLILMPGNCSRVPLMYTLCAHTQTYLHCPDKSWKRSEQCEGTKQFLKECMQTTELIFN